MVNLSSFIPEKRKKYQSINENDFTTIKYESPHACHAGFPSLGRNECIPVAERVQSSALAAHAGSPSFSALVFRKATRGISEGVLCGLISYTL